jgi:hypothetical protein
VPTLVWLNQVHDYFPSDISEWSVMLELYFVKPSTIDRTRGSWLGSQIESYVEWMEAHGYARPTVHRRVPLLFHFAEFAQKARVLRSLRPLLL